MTTAALLARNDSSLSVSLKTEGREWQARVLELAALIGRVNCAEEFQCIRGDANSSSIIDFEKENDSLPEGLTFSDT